MKKSLAVALLVVAESSLASPKEPLKPLLEKLKGVKSLKVEFTQKSKLPVAGDEVTLYKGVIYYKRPLKFRWEYTWGSKALLISDGKHLEVSFGDGECQVTELEPNTSLFPLIELVESPELFKESFRVVKVEREGRRTAITLRARRKEAFFKELTFVLDKGKLLKVKSLQEDGTYGVYRIEKMEKNLKLKDELFKLTGCKKSKAGLAGP